MKLIRLEIENFKKITAIAINLGKRITELTGANGAGKSSVLDGVWTLLRGAQVAPAVPIRKGSDISTIRGDFGELIVTRTFKRKGADEYTTELRIENPEGANFPAPQKKLDALIGQHMLDPLDFIHMDAKAQFDVLRRFVPGFDFEASDNLNRGDFQKRTDLNRKAKEIRAAALQIIVPPETPAQAIDESALIKELEDAGTHNADIETRKGNRERMLAQAQAILNEGDNLLARAEDLMRQATELRKQAAAKGDEAKALSDKVENAPPLPEPIDTTAVRQRIEAARATNANVKRLDERMAKHKQAADVETEADALTKRMDERTAEKQAVIAKAKMPVEGIGFGDGVVLLNALPFKQASSAEALRTATAISFALNPGLPLVWIRDGSLLDDDSLRIVTEVAEKHDGQVLIETVRSTSKDAIVLSDGHLAEAKTEAAA